MNIVERISQENIHLSFTGGYIQERRITNANFVRKLSERLRIYKIIEESTQVIL